jgi:hypothetical protein
MQSPSVQDMEELWTVCNAFIQIHKVSCPEATIKDDVYINSPHLVENIGDIVGYYKDPDEEDTD